MKRTLLLLLLQFLSFRLFAGDVILLHALQVERIECWAPDYLTVTCNYDNRLFLSAPKTLQVLSVITEVNGRSTEGMDTDEFYDILDSNTDIRLTYMTKIKGENKLFSEKLEKFRGKAVVDSNGTPSDMIKLAGNFYSIRGYNDMRDKNVIINDLDVDYFSFNTFDYAFNDAIEEFEQKQLLKEFATLLESRGMKKVDQDPDVYLYVTLQSDRSIETVYMPKQVTSYHENARGRITYGYYSTNIQGGTNSQTVTSEQGNMTTFTTNDVYLQITILDAKRMDSQQAPKVWQYTYMDCIDKTMTFTMFREKIKNYAAVYPFYPECKYKWNYFGNYCDVVYLGLYIDNYEISGSLPNSYADENNIRLRDKVVVDKNKKSVKGGVYVNWNGDRGYLKIGRKMIKRSTISSSKSKIHISKYGDLMISKMKS